MGGGRADMCIALQLKKKKATCIKGTQAVRIAGEGHILHLFALKEKEKTLRMTTSRSLYGNFYGFVNEGERVLLN